MLTIATAVRALTTEHSLRARPLVRVGPSTIAGAGLGVFANVARAHGLKPITHPRTVQGPLPDDALGSINDAFWGGISPEAQQLARSYAEITKEK